MTRVRVVVHRFTFGCLLTATLALAHEARAAAGGGPTELYIGPIPGLTTTWHPAPAVVSVPVGSLLRLKREVPAGGSVAWSGAVETAVQDGWSFAECPLASPGEQVVEVEVVGADGGIGREAAVFDVQNVPAAAVRLRTVETSVVPVTLDPQDLNASTYRYYRQRSIAALRRVGEDRYRTSVGRKIDLRAAVAPAAFTPLVEWYVRDEYKVPRTLVGSPAVLSFSEPGVYPVWVSIGPSARRIVFEIYRTRITSHESGRDVISDGVPVTFTAETDPPGYEEDITWLASTSYGSADPIMGQGPSFTVRFQDTFGRRWSAPHQVQWLGVRADNSVFGQDLKTDPRVPCEDVRGIAIHLLLIGACRAAGNCPTPLELAAATALAEKNCDQICRQEGQCPDSQTCVIDRLVGAVSTPASLPGADGCPAATPDYCISVTHAGNCRCKCVLEV